jgi:poly(hydroxyalkanoate) depolymerase family esterase
MQDALAMTEALRLTREGRLAEATALIQRTLRHPPGTPGRTPGAEPTADGTRSSLSGLSVSDTPMASWVRRSPRRLAPRWADRAGAPGRSGTMRPATADRGPAAAPLGGRFGVSSYTNAAGTRAYKLYVPTGYTGQIVPLIVMLHGGTQTANDFASATGMNQLADRDTFLVAYPEQARSANSMMCWNWFQPGDQRNGAGEPSLIAGITHQIMGAYSVDAGRVYVAGFSAGGAMAAVMASTYPDLYAAAGVHSGLPYGAAHDIPSAFQAMRIGAPPPPRLPARGIPLIVFHGDLDTIVDPVNADRLVDYGLRTTTTASGRAWTSQHGTTSSQGEVTGGHPYTRTVYQDLSGETLVEQWIIHQAGHAWSGGTPHGSFTDLQGPDASAELVRFFHDHARLGHRRRHHGQYDSDGLHRALLNQPDPDDGQGVPGS